MLNSAAKTTFAPQVTISQVSDPTVRKNFQNIQKFLNDETPFAGFRFLEFAVNGPVTNFKQAHNLAYVPRDIVALKITGSGTVTFNYDKFDASNIDITATGVAQVRVLVGTYSKDLSAAANQSVPQPETYFTDTGASSSSSSTTTTTTTSTYIPPQFWTIRSGSGTYTIPTVGGKLPVRIDVKAIGGGGGGAPTTGSGSTGGTTIFGPIILLGGAPGTGNIGGIPGVEPALPSNCIGITMGGNGGQGGQLTGPTQSGNPGSGAGGAGPWGGASNGVSAASNVGQNATANSGAGGGGSTPGLSNNSTSGGGGAAGQMFDGSIISGILAAYSFQIGAGGTGAASGGSGRIQLTFWWQ